MWVRGVEGIIWTLDVGFRAPAAQEVSLLGCEQAGPWGMGTVVE